MPLPLLYSSCTSCDYPEYFLPLWTWRLTINSPPSVYSMQSWASIQSVTHKVLITCFYISSSVLCLPVPVCQSTTSRQPLSNGDSFIRSQGQAAASAPCKKQQHRARYVEWKSGIDGCEEFDLRHFLINFSNSTLICASQPYRAWGIWSPFPSVLGWTASLNILQCFF